jgi:hypothetical protein
MRWDISGGPLPPGLPYADAITTAFEEANLSPMFGYAIAAEESIKLEVAGEIPSAASVIGGSGGYGLFQGTPAASGIALPENWQDPLTNARYAVQYWFNDPDQGGFPFWVAPPYNELGTNLIRCVAASYNAGRQGAIDGHDRGNVDMNTYGGNYAARVLANYLRLCAGQAPW